MANRIIDEMPMLSEVENAGPEQIVEWHLFLRPTMNNDELNIVKLITRRYDSLAPDRREMLAAKLRRKHG